MKEELARMGERRPNGVEELEVILRELWYSMPQEQINKLIDNMPRRVRAVYDAKGATPSGKSGICRGSFSTRSHSGSSWTAPARRVLH